MLDLHIVIRASTQSPLAYKIDFLSNHLNMWLKDVVDDSILEDVNHRLRGYFIRQMLNWLRFLLAVDDITDSGTKTFDEVCADEREKFIHDQIGYYDLQNLYVPNYRCLWDIIFNTLDYRTIPYTPIFSAYCRSNKIATKTDLYIKMSGELESWVDTIHRFEDIVMIAIGMSQNNEIWYVFYKYNRVYNKRVPHTTFYTNALDVLSKNNFENFYPHTYDIYAYKPIQTTYDDPLQQIFVKNIILKIQFEIQFEIQNNRDFKTTAKNICVLLSNAIKLRFSINIPIHPTDAELNIRLDTIDQIIDYCESKIPKYPAEIKDYLLILSSINAYISITDKITLANLAKMVELSDYNLRDLPIMAIICGLSGATPLEAIPLEQIPEYYERLTYSYSGKHTKPARI